MCELIPSFLKKNSKKYGTPIVILILCISVYYFSKESSTTPPDELLNTIPKEQQLKSEQLDQASQQKDQHEGAIVITSIVVDVKGSVENPGVYRLDPDSRVIDAILLAGGYTKNAQSRYINHAQKLQDEMIIYVPKKGEKVKETLSMDASSTDVPSSSQSTPQEGETKNLVNINTSDESGLTTLNGIGPSKAKAIIAYRTENGPFKTIDDLKNVTGIGEKTFESLKEYITVK